MKVRKRILLLAVPIAAMLALALLWYWIARTDHFQNFARATLESKIREASGLDCSIKSVKFDVFRGNFLISEVAMTSREKPSPQIKITVQEIKASISVSSFVHLRARLADLTIIRPVVELAASNRSSPWNPDDLLRTLKLSFRLEAANVVITDGFVRANDFSAPFYLSLEDLDCTIGYVKKPPSYRLSLKYKKSRIKLGERDIVHDLDLQASVSTDGIAFERYRLVHGGTVLTGAGSMVDWRSPAFSISMNGNLDARDLRLTSDSLFEGKGNISVNASLSCDKDGVRSTGKFNAGPGQYRKMKYEGITGAYEISHDVLYLKNLFGRVEKGGARQVARRPAMGVRTRDP